MRAARARRRAANRSARFSSYTSSCSAIATSRARALSLKFELYRLGKITSQESPVARHASPAQRATLQSGVSGEPPVQAIGCTVAQVCPATYARVTAHSLHQLVRSPILLPRSSFGLF